MYRKSQSSLEFLTTYVWAFMALILTLGALYYFGFLNFSKYLPQKCIFPSQFKCLDFSLPSTQVKFRLVNNIGEDVNLDTITITNDATPPIACTTIVPTPPYTWVNGAQLDFTFSSCAGGGYSSNARVELKISMNYFAVNTPSHPVHVISGKINGRVI